MIEGGNILTLDNLDEPPGLEVIDQLERLRYQLWTSEPVSPTPVDPDSFHFPVSNAFEIAAETVSFPAHILVCIRNASGDMITDVGHLESETLDEGAYILELEAQIKTYVEVEGPMTIRSQALEKEIAFGQRRQVRVGMRSRHERPAATVKTTEKPRDMMAAISTFGSALKSTTPERSYPTLRGHPPDIELGESLDIPDIVEPPETGVRIEIPESYEAVYTVAPLAYYLGAEVVPGDRPRLRTDDGFVYALDSYEGLETETGRVLRQLLTLDCVARTDGLYDVDLHERHVLEERISLDFAAVYDSPLSEQVETYLSVPYRKVEDCIPAWRLTAHVEPIPQTIEQLPFVVNDLATVQITRPQTTEGPSVNRPEQQLARAGEFTRSTAQQTTRSTTKTAEGPQEQYVELPDTESLEQTWIGDGIPIGANKLTKKAFKNWFDREKVEGDISITVVVNDSRMNEEWELVNQVYGNRDDLPFDIKFYDNLTVSRLREVLSQERSFLHYIGHVEEDGFVCEDGTFDAATLESTGIDAFMLNACDSYQQGRNLIEAGAVGGIVTLNAIVNKEAVKIGETIAHLLNSGFPLDTSLSIAREESVFGGQYIVVGASSVTVTQKQSLVPNMIEIVGMDEIMKTKIITHTSNKLGIGSLFMPHIADNTNYYLASGEIDVFSVTSEQLEEFLSLEDIPVRKDNEIYWSSSLNVREIKQS